MHWFCLIVGVLLYRCLAKRLTSAAEALHRSDMATDDWWVLATCGCYTQGSLVLVLIALPGAWCALWLIRAYYSIIGN